VTRGEGQWGPGGGRGGGGQGASVGVLGVCLAGGCAGVRGGGEEREEGQEEGGGGSEGDKEEEGQQKGREAGAGHRGEGEGSLSSMERLLCWTKPVLYCSVLQYPP